MAKGTTEQRGETSVSLQCLRGLAAWAVVLHHIAQCFHLGHTDNPIIEAFHRFGAFGVDVFFVLSGVVMALVSRRYHNDGIKFGINRLFRVAPVYWFYTLVLVGSILLLPQGTYQTGWKDWSLVQSLLFLPNPNPNGMGYFPTLFVGWTIVYEIFFYLCFAAILVARIPKPAISCATVLVIIAFGFRYTNFLGQNTLLLLHFAAGIALLEFLSSRPVRILPWLRFAPAVALAVITGGLFMLGKNFLAKMMLASLIVYGSLLAEPLFRHGGPVLRFLKYLGDISYSTYLSHVVVIGWVYAATGGKDHVPDLVSVPAILLVVLTVSAFSFKWIETSQRIMAWKRWTLDTLSDRNRPGG